MKVFRGDFLGTKLTSKLMQDVLVKLLDKIEKSQEKRGDLVLAGWKDVVDGKFAHMTQALSFEEGILSVKVKNSTLYSLLSQQEKPRLLESLKKKFPRSGIRDIRFRI